MIAGPNCRGGYGITISGLVKELSELAPAGKPKTIIHPRQDLTHLKSRFDDAVTRSRNWR